MSGQIIYAPRLDHHSSDFPGTGDNSPAVRGEEASSFRRKERRPPSSPAREPGEGTPAWVPQPVGWAGLLPSETLSPIRILTHNERNESLLLVQARFGGVRYTAVGNEACEKTMNFKYPRLGKNTGRQVLRVRGEDWMGSPAWGVNGRTCRAGTGVSMPTGRKQAECHRFQTRTTSQQVLPESHHRAGPYPFFLLFVTFSASKNRRTLGIQLYSFPERGEPV